MPLFNSDITQEIFFEHYWRRKPYVFKRACIDSVSQLKECTQESVLLELASREIVESRIVNLPDYKLSLGPFQLDKIPEDSLLMIQGLEQYLDEINELLLRDFSFLPRWRIEDVMATAGSSGANCGAHFDHYDVFLIQAKGTKDWRLGTEHHSDSDLEGNTSIRLLSTFEPDFSETLYPGDVLYIPPCIGHWGLSGDESITLSVGIRNPTMQELVSNLADLVVEESGSMETLDDLIPSPQGGLSDKDINNLQAKLAAVILDPELIEQWYGSYVTELREPENIEIDTPLSIESIRLSLSSVQSIKCKRPTRLTYYSGGNSGKTFSVFINGDAFECNPLVTPWLEQLCIDRTVLCKDVPDKTHNIDLLQTLFNYGAIEFCKEVEDD